MSSLAAARADNFYIDPARFDPNVKGRNSVNALANSHPLGVRAARLYTEGILVIRFEMPYNVWCCQCGHHVGKGTRFNADKRKDGAYYSTTIWRFDMKCPACPCVFVIRTDPAGGDYEFVSGLRKQEKSFSPAAAGTLAGTTREQAAALSTSALYRIEHETDDKRRAREAHKRLAAMAEIQAARYADDGQTNARLRAAARHDRVERHDALAQGAALGLAIPLAKEEEADVRRAHLVMTAAGVDRRTRDNDGRPGSGPLSQPLYSSSSRSAASRQPLYGSSSSAAGRPPNGPLSQPLFSSNGSSSSSDASKRPLYSSSGNSSSSSGGAAGGSGGSGRKRSAPGALETAAAADSRHASSNSGATKKTRLSTTSGVSIDASKLRLGASSSGPSSLALHRKNASTDILLSGTLASVSSSSATLASARPKLAVRLRAHG